MGKENKSPERARWLGPAVDLVVVVGVLGLIGLQRLTPAEGLPWLAAVLAGRLKPRGNSGTLSMFGIGS
jgi:hypothetical protein